MSSERLGSLAAPDVPQLGGCIASTRYEDILVGAEGQTHNIPSVVTELYNADTSLNIPEHAGHITRAGDNLTVIEESATTEITGMSAQFTGTLDVASVLAIQVVYGTNVVKTTAGDEVPGRGVGTGHDPTRS